MLMTMAKTILVNNDVYSKLKEFKEKSSVSPSTPEFSRETSQAMSTARLVMYVKAVSKKLFRYRVLLCVVENIV